MDAGVGSPEVGVGVNLLDRKGTNYGGKVLRAVSGSHSYKLGVIDFLTRHNAMKTMETNIKSALFQVRRSSISA